MEEKINLIASQLGEIRVKKNINLSDYLESKLVNEASAIFIATSTQELIKAVNLCRELKLDYLLIGSGSKIMVSNNNFEGLVIKNRSHNLKIFGVKGKVSRAGIGIKEAFIEADSGVNLTDLLIFSSGQGLGGFENLSNITGTIGGSILNNLLLRENTTSVKVLDKSGSEAVKDINKITGKDVILKVIFHLKAKEV
ncbi:MAG: FAD-binding protein [Candidatus Daviesbacteria bacterium]|nr:FAD-binding protein [Candidatus Daviesbacteria bacterium]